MIAVQADDWLLRRHAFEAIVAGSTSGPDEVDLDALRRLCSEGIPDEPAQLRPLMYDLLLGVIPTQRDKWKITRRKQRQDYYTALQNLSDRLNTAGEELNTTIRRIQADMIRLSNRYPVLLEKSRPRRSSRLHPPRKRKQADSESSSASESTPATARAPLEFRRALFQHLENLEVASSTPKDSPPRITLSGIPMTPPLTPEKEDQLDVTADPVTLLSPHTARQPDDNASRYDTHSEALIRLLSVISITEEYNPAFSTIIVPLYLTYAQALQGKARPTFAEEETYWAMLALIDHLRPVWSDTTRLLSQLGHRLRWADEHLHSILLEHELDPASPLYTYRWITELLAADLELNIVTPLWDTIMSTTRPVDALLDCCCAMLLASKKHLFRTRVRRGLWGDAVEETEVDFVQALTFLRDIPVEMIGGLPAIMGAYSALEAAGPVELAPKSVSESPAPLPHPSRSPAKTDLATRSASLTTSVTAKPNLPSMYGSLATPPRQLMLSERARRASNPISATMRRSSTSSSQSLEATLSPPASTGMYRIGSRGNDSPGPRRALLYEPAQMAVLAVGLSRRRLPARNVLPMLAARLKRDYANYPDHVKLNSAQNALLAVGSGVVGVLDTSRGDLVATLSESTASTFLPSLHAAMVSHPEGRQIMRDQPIVSSSTVNLDHLRSLKRGTLGREYVEWLTEGGLTPDTREKVRYIDSPTLAYTMLRYRQTHDLYHTLFSLPPTLPHELTLKVVELSNMSLPVAGLSSAFGPFRLSSARRSVWLKDWAPWALRVGREGKPLVGVYWEKRWAQGLGDLRRELGVYRNDIFGVESRWKGYRDIRERERELRQKGEWVDEPESW